MKPKLNWEIEGVNWRGLGVWAITLIAACYQILYGHDKVAKALSWGVIFLFLNVLLVNLFAGGKNEAERG